jgi:hypothetical protein
LAVTGRTGGESSHSRAMLAGLAATSVGGEGALLARRWTGQVVLAAVARWASHARVLILERLVGVGPARGASMVPVLVSVD